MSRSRKKHPEKSCRVGRKSCGCCQLFGFGRRARTKDERRDAGRSDDT